MYNDIFSAMFSYYSGDIKRIQHFIKVHTFAKLIGENENISPETQNILEIASIVHDIGIKNSELKYHSTAGKYQETEGGSEAEKLLSSLGYPDNVTERVKFLVEHHHTYSNIDGIDWQILLEADFIVNACEDNLSEQTIRKAMERFFRTDVGINLLCTVFDIQ